MERVGSAGTGHIGLPMAVRLAQHEVPLTVYNRTAAQAQRAIDAGAVRADTVAELVKDVTIAIEFAASVGENATLGSAASEVFQCGLKMGFEGLATPSVVEVGGPFRPER